MHPPPHCLFCNFAGIKKTACTYYTYYLLNAKKKIVMSICTEALLIFVFDREFAL